MAVAVRRLCRVLVAAVVLLGLGACSEDGSPTAPDETRPSLLLCPVGDICGNSDGVIHDGTGNGTLTVVPGDPSPGADGIWLGNTVSKQWCFRDWNPFIQDADHDWLDDNCEEQLARAFAPALAISPTDGCAGGEPYWAAKAFANVFAFGWWVRIAYMPAYYLDCGANLPLGVDGPHDGDSEFFMLGVRYNEDTRHWQLWEGFTSAHYGTLNDHSVYTTNTLALQFPSQRLLAYPLIWVARQKHANYWSQIACNGPNDCNNNVTMGRIKIYGNHNVGSRWVDYLPNGVPSANPQFAGNGRLEYFYNPNHPRFGGWQPFADGVTPYYDILSADIFECFDNPILGVSSDCGPPQQPPATTKLQAIIDGPTSVPGNQQSQWPSFVTGGQVPYTAQWSRKYTSEPSPQVIGTTTGTYQNTTSTAGTLTWTVDRCESFTLSVRVTSTDGQVSTDDQPVTISSCPPPPPPPPPPLTVTINGPGGITVKGTYTYTAVISGFSGPSYAWSQRYCTSTSCQAWTNLVGYTTSVSRVLTPDCSGDKANRYEIKVVVRNSDGRSATSTRQTGLCGGLN
jgi:hypothetical protein